MSLNKIVVDAMGGDYAPEEVVKGTLDALEKDSQLEVVLVGDLDKIDVELINASAVKDRLELVDAKDVITNDDIPTVAIKQKKESSLVKAMDRVAGDENVGGRPRNFWRRASTLPYGRSRKKPRGA